MFSVWTTPWHEGRSSVSSQVPGEYPVALDGRPFLIEPREYRRGFVPTQRPGQDDSEEPGEQSLTTEGPWRRSQSDWSLGAGQVWLDEEESSRRRFRSSIGIDVFTEREFSLLPGTEEKLSTGQTSLQMLGVGDYLYVRDGATVRFTNAPEAASWTTTAATNHGGNALDMTSSGAHVYILGADNSLYRATPGTQSFGGAPYINPAAAVTRIWVALGRLFAAAANVLYEVTTTSETAIITHPDASFRWEAVIGTPFGLFIAGNNGTDGEIRQTSLNDDGSAWMAPVVAASFHNETVRALAAASTAMVIGTSLGWRFAAISSDGLDYGPVVTAPGDVRGVDVEVANAETFFVFGWSNIETGRSGLGRIRAARFVEPLVPAYASDVSTADGGTVLACLAFEGRRYFATSGGGFYGSTTSKVASGTLRTGRIRYGLLDAKVFNDVGWRTAPLDGQVQVVADFDDGSQSTPGIQANQDSVSSGEFTLGPRSAEWAEIVFTLTRATDVTQGPVVRWWVMRAIPSPSQTERIVLPIRLARKGHGTLGSSKLASPLTDRSFVAGLCRSHAVVRYQEGLGSELVYVQNMEERPDQWNETDHCFEGLLLVEMLTTG